MTLNDINELSMQIKECTSCNDVLRLFDDAGEDADENSVKVIFDICKGDKLYEFFKYSEDACSIYTQMIRCAKCKNTSSNTLLASAAEILSAADEIHFGCCECGTQFSIKKTL